MLSRFAAPLLLSASCLLATLSGCSSSSDQKTEEADAGAEAGTEADAGKCPDDQPADDCGDCGGDGTRCMHPLAGNYAARTQFYARQRTRFQGSPLDLVSKGVVLSLVDIDNFGVATEHYCFLEIASAEGVVSWTAPVTLQSVPDTALQLIENEARFVRPLDQHRARFSWNAEAPADCVAGERRSSGCLCPGDDALPTVGDDCRVIDLDDDGSPGGKMYLTVGELPSVDSTEALVSLNVVALLSLGWRLPGDGSSPLVGSIEGGIQQAELSREGELSSTLGDVKSTMCAGPDGRTLGHVELVAGSFDCASLLAGRAADQAGYGVFDPALDGAPPAVDACPNPDCPAGDCPAP